ncbi:MAG: cobalamin-binding protein, partial [Myxococcota bacterium]|nr:cobalamin-binding protein [Myxococcota bacterium]
IVVLPCGFDVARSRQETHRLTALPGWDATPAARAGRVYVADGNRYFNRPGPRLAESLEMLAEILHPEAFDFGHRGDGYEPL